LGLPGKMQAAHVCTTFLVQSSGCKLKRPLKRWEYRLKFLREALHQADQNIKAVLCPFQRISQRLNHCNTKNVYNKHRNCNIWWLYYDDFFMWYPVIIYWTFMSCYGMLYDMYNILHVYMYIYINIYIRCLYIYILDVLIYK
jgi:hypothetical protein